MEIDYKIKINKITYLLGQVIFIGIITILSPRITCPFKRIFKIPCPFCGMTRSIKALLKLQIKESLTYNILLIPLLITILTIDIIIITEIITNKKIIKKRINTNSIIITIIIASIISIIWGIFHEI